MEEIDLLKEIDNEDFEGGAGKKIIVKKTKEEDVISSPDIIQILKEDCPEGKIKNKETKKCVNEDGAIGKKLISTYRSEYKKGKQEEEKTELPKDIPKDIPQDIPQEKKKEEDIPQEKKKEDDIPQEKKKEEKPKKVKEVKEKVLTIKIAFDEYFSLKKKYFSYLTKYLDKEVEIKKQGKKSKPEPYSYKINTIESNYPLYFEESENKLTISIIDPTTRNSVYKKSYIIPKSANLKYLIYKLSAEIFQENQKTEYEILEKLTKSDVTYIFPSDAFPEAHRQYFEIKSKIERLKSEYSELKNELNENKDYETKYRELKDKNKLYETFIKRLERLKKLIDTDDYNEIWATDLSKTDLKLKAGDIVNHQHYPALIREITDKGLLKLLYIKDESEKFTEEMVTSQIKFEPVKNYYYELFKLQDNTDFLRENLDDVVLTEIQNIGERDSYISANPNYLIVKHDKFMLKRKQRVERDKKDSAPFYEFNMPSYIPNNPIYPMLNFPGITQSDMNTMCILTTVETGSEGRIALGLIKGEYILPKLKSEIKPSADIMNKTLYQFGNWRNILSPSYIFQRKGTKEDIPFFYNELGFASLTHWICWAVLNKLKHEEVASLFVNHGNDTNHALATQKIGNIIATIQSQLKIPNEELIPQIESVYGSNEYLVAQIMRVHQINEFGNLLKTTCSNVLYTFIFNNDEMFTVNNEKKGTHYVRDYPSEFLRGILFKYKNIEEALVDSDNEEYFTRLFDVKNTEELLDLVRINKRKFNQYFKTLQKKTIVEVAEDKFFEKADIQKNNVLLQEVIRQQTILQQENYEWEADKKSIKLEDIRDRDRGDNIENIEKIEEEIKEFNLDDDRYNDIEEFGSQGYINQDIIENIQGGLDIIQYKIKNISDNNGNIAKIVIEVRLSDSVLAPLGKLMDNNKIHYFKEGDEYDDFLFDSISNYLENINEDEVNSLTDMKYYRDINNNEVYIMNEQNEKEKIGMWKSDFVGDPGYIKF